MASPNYRYHPRAPSTEQQRAAQSIRERRRLGIRDGFRRVYGVEVPEQEATLVRKYAASLAGEYGSETASDWVRSIADRDSVLPVAEWDTEDIWA